MHRRSLGSAAVAVAALLVVSVVQGAVASAATEQAAPVITFPGSGSTVPEGDVNIQGTLAVAATPTATTSPSSTATPTPTATSLASPAASASPTPSPTASSSGSPATPARTTVVYVVDISKSTADVRGLDCNSDGSKDRRDDLNRDGAVGDTLDCEIASVIALNRSIRRADVNVGLIAFATSAATADLTPGAVEETLISPPTRDTVVPDKQEDDVTSVALSLTRAKIGQFTPRQVTTLGTQFDPALQSVVDLLRVAGPGPASVFFLSDGRSRMVDRNGPLKALSERPDTSVNTYQVGDTGGCAEGQPLAVVDAVDGRDGCVEVSDPAALAAAISAPRAGVRLDVRLQPGDLVLPATVDALGDWNVTFPGLTRGSYSAEAIATYSDGTTTRSTVSFSVGPTLGAVYRAAESTRLLDTRAVLRAPLPAGGRTTVRVAGRGGVPPSATAAVINLTAVSAPARGFLTAWPSDTPRPGTSSLNVTGAGQTTASLVTVPLAKDGGLDVYSEAGGHVLVDLQGWYEPVLAPVAGGRFLGRTPVRLLDTRLTSQRVLPPGGSVTASLGASGVPADASVVAVNVTMTASTGPGFVTVGTSAPGRTSNLNVERAGQTRANMALVRRSSDLLTVTTSGGGALIVDVVGWYTGQADDVATRGLYVPVLPSRALDTRTTGLALPPDGVVAVDAAAALRVSPSAVDSAVGTVTLVGARRRGYLTAWPSGQQQPLASNINAGAAGDVVAGHLQVLLGGGRAQVRLQAGGHLVVDLTGYFRV